MKDDPLLSRLRELPAPALDPVVRDRVLARAESALHGEARRTGFVRVWSLAVLPAVLLIAEGAYLVDTLHVIARVFG